MPTLSMEGLQAATSPATGTVEAAPSTSSLDNDTELGSAEAEDCETNADRQVFSPRARDEDDVEGDTTILGWGGRVVKAPYVQRRDIGSFGLYAGNWGGPSRANLITQHLYHDIILRNPAQVLVAQEVDDAFAELLKNPRSQRQAPIPPASALAERNAITDAWLVLRGDEGPGSQGKSLLVAARKSLCRTLTLRHWEKRFDGVFKRRQNGKNVESKAYTRLMIADIQWNKKMYGRTVTSIANVHFHHKTAKKDNSRKKKQKIINRTLEQHTACDHCSDCRTMLTVSPTNVHEIVFKN